MHHGAVMKITVIVDTSIGPVREALSYLLPGNSFKRRNKHAKVQ